MSCPPRRFQPTHSRDFYRRVVDPRKLSPQEFEEYISFLLSEMGYCTARRGRVGDPDGGVDIDAWRGDEYVIVQCKRYGRSRVWNSAVLHLIGAVYVEQATRGMLVTTGVFTRAAIDKAQSQPVELVGCEGIREWQRQCKVGPFLEISEPALVSTFPRFEIKPLEEYPTTKLKELGPFSNVMIFSLFVFILSFICCLLPIFFLFPGR